MKSGSIAKGCCRWTGCCMNFSCRSTERRAMSESVSSSASVAALPFVYPLDDYYAHHGLELPAFERLTGEQVPEPYHSLLVHLRDMTPTLEGYHQSTIHLEILNSEQRGDFYFREVVLRLDGSEK